MTKQTAVTGWLCACVLACGVGGALVAQQPPAPLRLSTSTDLPGYLTAVLVFTAADADKDAVVTRGEFKTAVSKWHTAADAAATGRVTSAQLTPALNAAMPTSALAAMLAPGRGGQPQTPEPKSVQAMLAALPTSAPATPARPRKVLVLARAAGFVHATIPLAARTVEELGKRTGAWSTTITYDAADITAENLRQYDAIFLASTTGAFLDAPNDAATTAARRQALLDFVRGGKGLAGIHAASDSYHMSAPAPAGARGGGGGAANALAAFSVGGTLAPLMIEHGDRNKDQQLDRAEAEALADSWFAVLDSKKSGALLQSDLAMFALLVPKNTAAAVPQGPDDQVGTWPEFNRLIGGYFKFHWLDPQRVTVKIDDPKSPLTAMFGGRSFDAHDEIYTMAAASFSRDNVRVLTSIDYGRMSAEDKALESNPRADRDYGLSWIKREGQGRVFYEALGHSERIYAMRPVLEHLLAGIQYAIGDLKADDAARR